MRLRAALNPTLGLDDRVWDRPNLTSLNGQLRNENRREHGEPMYFWSVQGMYSPNLPATECPDHYQQQIMSFKKYISFANFWTNEISFRGKSSFVVGWETWGDITRTPWNCPHENANHMTGLRVSIGNPYIFGICRSGATHFSPALRFFPNSYSDTASARTPYDFDLPFNLHNFCAFCATP